MIEDTTGGDVLTEYGEKSYQDLDSDNVGEQAELPDGENAAAEEGEIESDGIAAEKSSKDYSEIAAKDLSELKALFPELGEIRDLTEIKNPLRYAALRDLGLSAEEAYLATNAQRRAYDTRAHLTSTVPVGAASAIEMPRSDYDMARELFGELSDTEIRKLYRKVTK
ncbi:MAG: hypothetical protein IKY62_06180 [Clostridia bacterium]|nr:hypothetical protein [Clostridia bacterium]